MIKKILTTAFLGLGLSVGFAQQVNNPAYQRQGALPIVKSGSSSASKTVATELVQTLLIDSFESAGEWSAFMPRDYGVAVGMRRQGVPRELKSDSNKYVLGVKCEFMRRDWAWVTITPAKPTKIRGITKSISMWVVGRNYKHMLSIIIRDYLGRMKFLQAEKMMWVGWKKVTINIPDTIKQENYKISEERGITFLGFRIDFAPEDIMGRPFYTYFDYLTADTDLFSEQNQNPDDMLDNW